MRDEKNKQKDLDLRYLRMAKDYLYGELSIPLGIAKNEVEEYISKQLDQAV